MFCYSCSLLLLPQRCAVGCFYLLPIGFIPLLLQLTLIFPRAKFYLTFLCRRYFISQFLVTFLLNLYKALLMLRTWSVCNRDRRLGFCFAIVMPFYAIVALYINNTVWLKVKCMSCVINRLHYILRELQSSGLL